MHTCPVLAGCTISTRRWNYKIQTEICKVNYNYVKFKIINNLLMDMHALKCNDLTMTGWNIQISMTSL